MNHIYDNELLQRMLKSAEFTSFIRNYNTAISIALAFATVTVVIMFSFNIVKYVKSTDNPNQKSMASGGILVCALGLIILGGIDTFYAILLSLILGQL